MRIKVRMVFQSLLNFSYPILHKHTTFAVSGIFQNREFGEKQKNSEKAGKTREDRRRPEKTGENRRKPEKTRENRRKPEKAGKIQRKPGGNRQKP